MKILIFLILTFCIYNVNALGWTNEATYDGYLWSSCANWPNEQVLDCVYHGRTVQDSNGIWGFNSPLKIYDISSNDGGLTWNEPKQSISPVIISDEYAPHITYDSYRNWMWTTYSRNTLPLGSGNEIVVAYKTCVTCEWQGYFVIAKPLPEKQTMCEGQIGEVTGYEDYWQSNMLITRNGTVLVSYNNSGPEGQLYHKECLESYGQLYVTRWEPGYPITTTKVSNTGNAEFMSMRENSNGDILGVFSRYSHCPPHTLGRSCTYHNSDIDKNGESLSNLHQIWSNDNGKTWVSESTLFSTGSNMIQPFLGIQQVDMSIPCPECQWTILYGASAGIAPGAYALQSTNEGLTWNDVGKISNDNFTTDLNFVPNFTVGCRGPFFTFSDTWHTDTIETGHKLYIKRYDWVDDCIL